MSAIAERWQRAQPLHRWAVAVVAAVVALNLIGFVLDTVVGGRRDGPVSSSFATDSTGLAAYVELLRRNGYEVDRSATPPSATDLDAASTVFVLDPPEIAAAEIAALRRFAHAGGRLVIGGSDPSRWLGLIEHLPEWGPGVAGEMLRPTVPVPEVEAVSAATSAGNGVWTDPAGTLPALGRPARPVLSVASPEEGRIVFIADPSLLQNGWLAEADNATLALSIAGGGDRPVIFMESFHGYEAASGFDAIPLSWRWGLALAALAAATWIAAHVRRLGPPDRVGRSLPPPRRHFVDALATTLARSPHKHEAIRPLLDRGRELLRSRLHLDPRADDRQIRTAAESTGTYQEEVDALLASIDTDRDVLRAGRAMARLTEGER